jgi:hypothetical protein
MTDARKSWALVVSKSSPRSKPKLSPGSKPRSESISPKRNPPKNALVFKSNAINENKNEKQPQRHEKPQHAIPSLLSTPKTIFRSECYDRLLERRWMFRGHYRCILANLYRESRIDLHKNLISTIVDFWTVWNSLPFVCAFIKEGVARIEIDGNDMDGLSLFSNGSIPEWEDPSNLDGITCAFLAKFTDQTINAVWFGLVLDLIGETMPLSERVVGMKTVSRNGKQRIELWLSKNTDLEPIKSHVFSILEKEKIVNATHHVGTRSKSLVLPPTK